MLRSALAGILAIAAAILLLAGCGDDEPSTVTVTESSTSSASTTEATTETEATTQATAEDGETPPAAQTVTKLTGFTSPSGNIGCYIDKTSVRCDISERSWEPPKAPKDCELDYGQGIELTAGAAPGFVCAGDTALGGGEELAYGESISSGLLRCESEESGMTCTDSETGRGFTISQESYELF